MAVFYPNFGKPPIEVFSKEDIITYYGKHFEGFDGIEIQDGIVLAIIKGEYVGIGRIQ